MMLRLDKTREQLIAKASWWCGWCTDNDGTIPELAQLSAFLLNVKHQMALDRPKRDDPGLSSMAFVDRLYAAWRVLTGHAVKVDVTFYGAGDHEMTVTFYGKQDRRDRKGRMKP